MIRVFKSLSAALALSFFVSQAQAAVLTFDDANLYAYDQVQTYGGLSFTKGGDYLFFWDGSSPNGNGTRALISLGPVTITRTGGGIFDLLSLQLALSFYIASASEEVTINGAPVTLTQGLTTFSPNLIGVSSVTITGLSGGYFLADNLEVELSAVPVPASLPLLAAGLAGLGLLRRRKSA